MKRKAIDYSRLKKRGFLKEKEEGLFTLRTRGDCGNYSFKQLNQISKIANKYARGIVHLTVRQGIEIPFMKFKSIDKVEEELKKSNIKSGTSGARLRATTSCPGNNWCKRGLVDTFSLFKKIEAAGLECGLDLPHKFKIVISGCPNACTRAQASEIGIHGDLALIDNKSRIGYRIFIGGCGGKMPYSGFKLKRLFSEDEVIEVIKKVVRFYKINGKKRQRLALTIKEFGKERFLKKIRIK